MATLRASGSVPEEFLHASPRSILYVITDLDVGGVPLHLLRLASDLHASGWRVAVVSLKAPGPVGDRLVAAGIPVETCNARSPWDWRTVERLAGHLAAFAPDLVHSFLFHANVASRVAALLSGFPRSQLVCEIQTVEIERRWHLAVDRLTHRLGRFTIGNSPSVVEHLHRRAGIPRGRLRCVPGGVDPERFIGADPIPRAALGVPDEAAVLLWVGRMDPVKGLDTLLAAVERLQRERATCLLLAGDGPLRSDLESETARRHLVPCVRFLGRRDDVPRLLASADVFVFPSRTEGLPNAVLEAMAAGTPIVATDVPGNRDLVTDGVTGRLVPVNDASALADAIGMMLHAPAAAREMADRARALVARAYTRGQCHQRYRALYDEILEVGAQP